MVLNGGPTAAIRMSRLAPQQVQVLPLQHHVGLYTCPGGKAERNNLNYSRASRHTCPCTRDSCQGSVGLLHAATAASRQNAFTLHIFKAALSQGHGTQTVAPFDKQNSAFIMDHSLLSCWPRLGCQSFEQGPKPRDLSAQTVLTQRPTTLSLVDPSVAT